MSLENKLVMVVDRKTKKTVEKFIADYPNLRTLKGFLDGNWNLAAYDECFPGKNRLGDVDASMELEGHTLLIEFKGARNGMNKGQVLKAVRQAKNSGITTFFVFGKRDNPEEYLKIAPDDSEKGFTNSGIVLANKDMVIDQFARWAAWAKANSKVTSKTDEWNEVTQIMAGLYK